MWMWASNGYNISLWLLQSQVRQMYKKQHYVAILAQPKPTEKGFI